MNKYNTCAEDNILNKCIEMHEQPIRKYTLPEYTSFQHSFFMSCTSTCQGITAHLIKRLFLDRNGTTPWIIVVSGAQEEALCIIHAQC